MSGRVTRRQITAGAAWAVPAVVAAAATPAFASSWCFVTATANPVAPALATLINGTRTGTANVNLNTRGGDSISRVWSPVDNAATGTLTSDTDFLVHERVLTYSVSAASTLVLSGMSVRTGFGNHCMVGSYGAGLLVQYSTNNVTWTTWDHVVTRKTTDTNFNSLNVYSGYALKTPTVLQPTGTSTSTCGATTLQPGYTSDAYVVPKICVTLPANVSDETSKPPDR